VVSLVDLSKEAALLGTIIGTFVATVIACLANVYVILPFYGNLYRWPMEEIITMTKSANPYVNSVARLVIIGIARLISLKMASLACWLRCL